VKTVTAAIGTNGGGATTDTDIRYLSIFEARVELVKRSGSEFTFEFSYVYQYLRTPVDFCVGRFVGGFIGRPCRHPISLHYQE
jgi:hypothetical protein